MPVFLGIPLIGWIQMVFGTAVVLFALIVISSLTSFHSFRTDKILETS